MNTADLNKTLPAPAKPEFISNSAQWLSGEGAGSWFLIDKQNDNYCITRFSPEGKTECKGIFNMVDSDEFNINEKYEFTYLSHCSEVNIIQKEKKYKFKRDKI